MLFTIIRHPGGVAATAASVVDVAADADDDRQGQHRLISLIVLFLVHHI